MPITLTEALIHELIAETKTKPEGLRPLTRQVQQNGHQRREFELIGALGSEFVLKTRQGLLNPLDFSVILGYKLPGVNRVFRLRRYNGRHFHTNTLERETFRDFHIHTATERYQQLPGGKEDHFAQVDHRFHSLETAINTMISECGFARDEPLLPQIPGLLS